MITGINQAFRRDRRHFLLGMVFVCAGLMFSACSGDAGQQNGVHVLKADGTVGPIMERFLDRGISRAEEAQARAVVIELDTPGGLNSSMRQIVQRIERSTVPVVVFVWPPGGRAASAGTFITMAGHVAAMGPNTSIGAAAAVTAEGGEIEGTMGKKVENDAVAFITGIAELRGRNAEWAEAAVREAVAANQTQAVELNVADFVANDFPDLLRQLEGRHVAVSPTVIADLTGITAAPVSTVSMTPWERVLEVLADPTIASLLLTIGFLGILWELANPGTFVPGIAGVVSVVLAFLAFGVMPVDAAGIVLIVIGMGLLALELFVPSGGVLGAGAAVALVLGAIIGFRNTPADLRPSYLLVAVLAFVVVGLFVSLAMGLAQLRRRTRSFGTEALIGRTAIARTALSPEGYVFIRGERWHARLNEGEASEGERVRIVGAEGLNLRVERENPQS